MAIAPEELQIGDTVECLDWDEPFPIGKVIETGMDDGAQWCKVEVIRTFYAAQSLRKIDLGRGDNQSF